MSPKTAVLLRYTIIIIILRLKDSCGIIVWSTLPIFIDADISQSVSPQFTNFLGT